MILKIKICPVAIGDMVMNETSKRKQKSTLNAASFCCRVVVVVFFLTRTKIHHIKQVLLCFGTIPARSLILFTKSVKSLQTRMILKIKICPVAIGDMVMNKNKENKSTLNAASFVVVVVVVVFLKTNTSH